MALAYMVHAPSDPFAAFFGPPGGCGSDLWGELLDRRCKRPRTPTPTARLGRVEVLPHPDAEGGSVVRMELPGFGKEDTSVELKDDVLTVTAQKGAPPANTGGEGADTKAPEDNKGKEREQATADDDARAPHVRVQRSWRLPEGTDPSDVTAVQADGVLTLTIAPPKTREEPEAVRIEIA